MKKLFISDSESFDTKDSNVSIPIFDISNANLIVCLFIRAFVSLFRTPNPAHVVVVLGS